MTDGDRYRRKLLFLLSSATFFEGYDTFVLAFVLALILGDLGGSEADAGWIRAITQLGAVAGFLLAGQADRIGRKRLLLITIIGYTATTALTALSPGLICSPSRRSARRDSSAPSGRSRSRSSSRSSHGNIAGGRSGSSHR